VRLFRPLPPGLTRPLSWLALVAWVVQMALLVDRSYLQAANVSLAGDLARYGSGAQWKGVYYHGEKIGFTVSQTRPLGDGYEIDEDGQLQMSLLGVTTPARMRTRVEVDRAFGLQSFSFSLDPGTGPMEVSGALQGRRLALTVRTAAGTRTEARDLPDSPALSLNLSRLLAAAGLQPGRRFEIPIFDPATLRNAPMTIEVTGRELVRAAGPPIPAFKLRMQFSGIAATSWVTDTGEVVREESPTGLVVVKETAEVATRMAFSDRFRKDVLEAAAVVPAGARRIDEPTEVRRLKIRLENADLGGPDVQGAGQSVAGDVVEIVDARQLTALSAEPDVDRYLAPETFLESDAPEIVEEAHKAIADVVGPRGRAERLARHVNALLEKKPTISLPSAREVLRTRVGDCNEHTALYVALARAAGIPARIAVGLVHLHGAFYYHAWPEVFLAERGNRGLWIPVDPTLNQFPADATHVRLARGGLDRQAALMGVIGRLKMTILDLEMRPGYNPVIVGRTMEVERTPQIPLPPVRRRRGCSLPR
jgi:transglutaminase-like putative cysteine protease